MAEASSEIKLNGLHHLALVCRDMERTVDFYTRVLGLKLKKGFDLPGYGQHFFFDMGNGSELAFFWFNDAEPAQPGVAAVKNIVGSRQGNISSAHGSMNHVAFSVSADDIVAYREKLIAKGVDCTPVVPMTMWSPAPKQPITQKPSKSLGYSLSIFWTQTASCWNSARICSPAWLMPICR